jgi:acyl-CoA synthetase (AMP-forming)/AMP-acid ligase II
LLLRGPNITIGYWREPGVIDSAMKSDWFHTGDFMQQDETGELRFVSSKEDLIIRGASKIFPVEVERALLSHPAVEDAGVVGVPDGVLGQRVAGFVQLINDLPGSILEDILTGLALQLADYKVPDSLTIVDEIPRNPQGEIDRNLLLAMISSQKTAATPPSGRDERAGSRHQRSVSLSRIEDTAVESDFSIGSSRNLSSAAHSS